jgi:pimeloyl-ACP methyl ester carboxylesterase
VNSQAFQRFMLRDSAAFANSEAFAESVVKNDVDHVKLVLFDHAMNDWRDVIRTKVNVPTAIFTGVYSDSLQGQRWIHSAIPNSELHVYTAQEQGDHFLAFKNPFKFTADLRAFLER